MEYMEQQMQQQIEAGISNAERCYARIAEMEEQNAALAAQVEAVTSAYKNLCGAINDMDDCETGTDEMETAIGAVFHAMRNGYGIVNATPQHHLRQVRADAGRDGFIEGFRYDDEIHFNGAPSDIKIAADKYHASILAGKE